MQQTAKTVLIAASVSALVASASAGAATLVITSANIKNGTIQTVDMSAAARTALKGQKGAKGDTGATGAKGDTGTKGDTGATGPQGPAGVQGPAGTVGVNGEDGQPGQTGAAGPSLLVGSGSASNNAVSWAAISGGAFGSEAGAQRALPPGPDITARDLAVNLSTNTNGAGTTVTIRKNGADTALTCTVPAGDDTCTSSATVVFATGDLAAIEIDNTGTTATPNVGTVFKFVY